nr:amidohydrolase family protein [uncultured Novosphingobium sp.]
MSEADPAIGAKAVTHWPYGPIFDADAHIDPPHDMWKDYLPAHLKDRAPFIEHGEDGDYICFEGNRRPFMMINNQAGREGQNFKMKGRLADQRKVWDPATRLADMDADGMDAALLFGGGPLGSFDNELYMASYEAYQNWVLDFCSAAPERLFPVGYVPMRDVDETVEHVRRLAGKGFRAINLPAFPQNPDAWNTSSGVAALKSGQVSALTGDPKGSLQYYQPEFDRLWAALCDHDLVATFHLGARVPRFGEKQFFLPDMPMSKLAMAEPIGILIYNGVFDRFPALRVGSMESGVGWFAWYAEYNDRTWEKQRFWTESPLKNPPSWYMDHNLFGSFIQDRAGILNRDLPGGRNIMWSSDYPHSETTFPRSREVILRDFEGVPEADVRAIVHDNCRRMLALS